MDPKDDKQSTGQTLRKNLVGSDKIRLRQNVDQHVAAPNEATTLLKPNIAWTTIINKPELTDTSVVEGLDPTATGKLDSSDSKQQPQSALETIAGLEKMITDLEASRDRLRIELEARVRDSEFTAIADEKLLTRINQGSMIIAWSLIGLNIYDNISIDSKFLDGREQDNAQNALVVLSVMVCFTHYIRGKVLAAKIGTSICVFVGALFLFIPFHIHRLATGSKLRRQAVLSTRTCIPFAFLLLCFALSQNLGYRINKFEDIYIFTLIIMGVGTVAVCVDTLFR